MSQILPLIRALCTLMILVGFPLFYYAIIGGSTIMTVGMLCLTLFQSYYSIITLRNFKKNGFIKLLVFVSNISVSLIFLDLWIGLKVTGLPNSFYGYLTIVSFIVGLAALTISFKNPTEFKKFSQLDLSIFCVAALVSISGLLLKHNFYILFYHIDKSHYYRVLSTRYINNRDYNMARTTALKSLSFNDGDIIEQSSCYRNIGISEYANGSYYEADSLLKISLDLVLSTNHQQKDLLVKDIKKHILEVQKRRSETD